jgi:hypothetical protein
MEFTMQNEPEELSYHSPKVSVFGDVRDLTQKKTGVTDNNKSKGPNHMSS